MTLNPQISLYTINQTQPTDGWLLSDWAAGQTSIMNWEDQNVTKTATGEVQLKLGAAPSGSSRPFNGAEFQSSEVATTGTFSWTAQAPKMVDGAVFGMFSYRADWQNQPWVEFDFEFVGKDTTKVQLNIHMEDASGRHISLDQAKGGSIIVDLGFDGAQGMHTYDVTVANNSATFRVDGRVVGVYGAADMPGGVWQIGPQKSYVDLWCASGLDSWTGKWAYNGTPLVAKVQGADVRPGDLTGLATTVTPAPVSPTPVSPTPVEPAPSSLNGDTGNNSLTGTSGNDSMAGNGGNDTLTGAAGNDSLSGGEGNDMLRLDAGNDLLDGGNGSDWLDASGTVAVRVDLGLTTAQATGYGTDTLRNIEHFAGGSGNDVALGNDAGNQLTGNLGNDQLSGLGGNDTLTGGAGDDVLTGGVGNDQVFGGDGSDRMSLGGGDDLIDGGAGSDWVTVTNAIGITVNLSVTTAQNTGSGYDTIRNVENVSGNSASDRLTGNSVANILQGMGGSDTLSGASGADTLDGGTGTDALYGGADTDRDVFVFKSASESTTGSAHDTVFNFVAGVDDFDLRGIDANTAQAGDQAFAFTGSTASAYGVWAVASGSDMLLRADVNGDRVADFEVLVANAHSVGAGDFLL